MKVLTKQVIELPPEEMAKVLVSTSPDEFARFWFAFSKELVKQKVDLNPHAMLMAMETGSLRKEGLNKLHSLMKYYEVKNDIEKTTNFPTKEERYGDTITPNTNEYTE